MHLTLHFLGEVGLEEAAAALRTVSVPPFSIPLVGVGQFPTRGGTTTLWAGVQRSRELARLHEETALALQSALPWSPDPEYRPHITLARCERETPSGRIAEFLSRDKSAGLPDLPVTAFHVFSSRWLNGIPAYRIERSFPLS